MTNVCDIAILAARALHEKKAHDIVALDMLGRSDVADCLVLGTGMTPPQIKALRNETMRALKAEGISCYRQTGVPDCGWVVLDYLTVVIHILLPEARRYYAIEALWPKALRLEWQDRPR